MARISKTTVFALINLVCLAAADMVADRASRKKCPYYQQMQCLLDVSEKACEPDEEPLSLLDWGAQESIWLCCCPKPYKACAQDTMDATCMDAVGKHLTKDTVQTRSDMVAGLQKARGVMHEAAGDKCSALAPAEPISVCGNEGSPKKSRTLDRQDLFCEMVTWQWEELGDGNPAEFEKNGCVFEKSAQAKKANSRKGGKLSGSRPQKLTEEQKKKIELLHDEETKLRQERGKQLAEAKEKMEAKKKELAEAQAAAQQELAAAERRRDELLKQAGQEL